MYLHRTGRTGRAGNKGTAVTFVDWDDVPRWTLIDKALEIGQPSPVETYHTSEHLYADLDIPRDAGGVLPRSRRPAAGLQAEELVDLGETGGRRRGGSGRSGGRSRRDGAGPAADGRTKARARAEGRPLRAGEGAEPGGGRSGEGEAQPRRRRNRRRTRGGKPVSRPAAH
jgi:superfamily II DNA/RNA helicase